MNSLLTAEQRLHGEEAAAFALARVAPFAAEWDRAQSIPRTALAELGRAGYLGALLPVEFGGRGWDMVTFGLINEALGRHDSAFTGYVTVQAMIGAALAKWGTAEQRRTWLPPLARGEKLGAFALTEPAGGSDLAAMTTTFASDGHGGWRLNGEKKWISGGQGADVFLVFGRAEGKPFAALVPRESPGLEIEPIRDLLGFRAAGLAQLRFRDVLIPQEHGVGKPGFALSHLAPVGLHAGRISTACSALGLLRGCVEESAAFAAQRQTGTRRLGDLGMIQTLLAKMGVDLAAGQLLCWNACRMEDEHRPESFTQALIAKYFVSRAAVRAAGDAVQIHGAAGCHESAPVARLFRASKLMEIIEGTTQIHERLLAGALVQAAAARTPHRVKPAF